MKKDCFFLTITFTVLFHIIAISQNTGINNEPFARAELLYQNGSNDSALAILNSFTNDTTSNQSDTILAKACNLAGNIYEEKGDFAKAYAEYYRAVKLFYGAGAKQGLANAVNNVANMYYRKGLYEQALKYQAFALKVRTGVNDTTGIASSYNNIGNIYYSWKQYEKALKFYNKAIKLKSESHDSVEMINIRMNIGSAWLGLKNYETARFHYIEALRLADLGNDMVLKADGLINLGYTDFLGGDYDAALEMYNKAMDISRDLKLEFEQMLVMKNMGELYLKQGDFSMSFLYLDSAESICRKLDIRESQLDIIGFRISLFSRQGKYKEAWELQQQYEKLNEDIFNETSLQQLYDFQTIQEYDARQREIRIKDLEISLQDNQLKTMRLLLIVAFLLLIFLSSTFYLLFKNRYRKKELEARQRQYAAMQKALSAQMNPHFISNSLSSIQNYFLNNDIPSASDYLNRFGKLIRKVLDLSMKEYISLEEEFEMIRLYVQLEALRIGKTVEFKVIVPEDFPTSSVAVPPLLLQPVIENSIWHGISNQNEAGVITVNIEIAGQFFYCIVTDNGAGIEAAKSGLKPHKEKSYGLGLIRERIAMMMPGIAENDLCNISEIKDGNGNVTGVSVKMKIPLRYV